MKNLVTLLLIVISMNLYSQIELAPENPILQNVTTLSISEDNKVKPLPTLPVNDVIQKPGKNGTRVVYFIHGLGGSPASWLRAGVACENTDANTNGFRARDINSSLIDYTDYTGSDMNAAVNAVKNHIRGNSLNSLPSYNPDRSKNFIIAHSQGGLVTRSLLKNDTYSSPVDPQTRGYGGFVTIASPLQGAMILNNNQQILNMANDACVNLIKGPTSNLFAKSVFTLLGKDFQNNLCNVISFNVLPYMFKDNTAPITNDYHVGSLWINQLNNSCNNPIYKSMPKVAFYGVEPNANLFWRTTNWFKNSPNDPSYWEANDDFAFYNNDIHPKILEYNSNLQTYKNKKANLQSNWGWYYITGAPGISVYNILLHQYNMKIDDWQAGVNWFNRANDQWSAIVGSKQYVLDHTETIYACIKYSPVTVTFYTNPNDCVAPYHIMYSTTQYYYNTINKESDGVVLAESAYNLPWATHLPVKHIGIEYTNGTFSGSSHMQIRNDEALKKNLTRLFNGNYGDYFFTIEK